MISSPAILGRSAGRKRRQRLSSQGLGGPDAVYVGDVSCYEIHGVLGRVGCKDHDSVVGSECGPSTMNLDSGRWTFLNVLQLVRDRAYSLSLRVDETDVSLLWHVFLSSVPVSSLGPRLFIRYDGLTLSPYSPNSFSPSFCKGGSEGQSIRA